MSDDEYGDVPEQFSDVTRTALREAAASLLQAVQDHADILLTLGGGTGDVVQAQALNDVLERHVHACNERVFDHTGTIALSLDEPDDEFDEFDEFDGEFDEPADGTPVVVVSRWDLVVTDAEALRQAGREAHQRLHDESEEDASVAVSTMGAALYALLHERGEPWYTLPGVDVGHGVRKIIRTDAPVEILPDDDIDAPITEPDGECLHGESWAHV